MSLHVNERVCKRGLGVVVVVGVAAAVVVVVPPPRRAPVWAVDFSASDWPSSKSSKPFGKHIEVVKPDGDDGR